MSSDSAQPPNVVILHVSDTQFGQYHSFARGLDSLSSRLIQDLATLQVAVPRVDLLIISGDIAEQGRPAEFVIARQFISDISASLGLSLDRVSVAPGNHDVNWNLCRAYFADCAARELEPVAPFAPKYEFYLDFLASIRPPRSQETFHLQQYEELDLTVATLTAPSRGP